MTRQHCEGFTLIETLVAVSLFVMTLAGTTALQVRALQDSEEASRRARAAMIAADYLRRMAMTPGVSLANDVDTDIDPTQIGRGCFAAGDCSIEAFARAQFYDWRWRLQGSADAVSSRNLLPDARMCVRPIDDRLAVVISWPALSSQDFLSAALPCVLGTPGARRALILWDHREDAS